jgi:MFS family permease
MAYTDTGGVWVLLLLNAGLSAVNAFDLTSRQALLTEMLDTKEDLGNAIALNSSIFNSARLIGPAIAGQLIPFVGEAGCFLINGLSFLAVLVSLLSLRLTHRTVAATQPPVWHGLREGLQYSLGSFPIRTVLLLVALISLLGVPYNVLLPVVAKELLQGDEKLYGWLLASSGLGALTGALFLASRRSVFGLLRGVFLTPAVVGACLLTLSSVHLRYAAFTLLFLIGMSIVTLLTTCNTVLQTIVPDGMRGRLLSLYAVTFMGLAPLGGLFAGWLTDRLGIEISLRVIGSLLVLGAILFAWFLAGPLRLRAREAYRAKGMAAEVPVSAEADA